MKPSRVLRVRVAFVVLGLAGIFGCSASRAPEQQTSFGPSVSSVGSVAVTIGDSIGADKRQVLDEINGTGRLKSEIENALRKAAKLDPDSSKVLEAAITDFRLRSGATVFWLGIMAGVDILDVDLQVRDGGKVIRKYETGVGSSGAWSGLTSSSRFQPMAEAVGARVAEGL